MSVRMGPQWLVIAALGAACSLLLTGFVFGVDNNAFHLPIVASLYDEPQFHDDAFIQSLRYFASGLWLLLRGSAKVVDPYWLFLCLSYVSRLLAFSGFLLCASLLGVQGWRRGIAFAAVICIAALLQGEAAAGDGGLFLNYFTHSEVANGTILIAIYFALRARMDWALVFLGITFFINVFMAFWLCAPLAAVAATYLAQGTLDTRRLIRQVLVGGAVFAVCAIPVLYNIVSNPDFGAPLTFDYTAFTKFHYPYHFLPGYTPAREYVELACVSALALVSLIELGAAAAPLRVMFMVMVGTYLIGVIAPLLISSPPPLLLNLSLLRSGVLLYLLAALAAAAVAVNWLWSEDRVIARLFAPLFIVALAIDKQLVPAAIILVLLKWTLDTRAWNPPRLRLDWAAWAVLALLVWPRDFARAWQENAHDSEFTEQLSEVGDWAREHTPPSAVFLMPTEWQRKGVTRHAKPYVVVDRDIVNAQGAFVYHAHRRLRGSFKEGAAMLWTPSFYNEWRHDVDATLRLNGLDQKLAYAKRNGIGYVLASCIEAGYAGYTPLMHTANVCVFAPK